MAAQFENAKVFFFSQIVDHYLGYNKHYTAFITPSCRDKSCMYAPLEILDYAQHLT